MFWLEIMFQIIGSLVIAFMVVFLIFLRVHGNPMRNFAKWTHDSVSVIKDVVLDMQSNQKNCK